MGRSFDAYFERVLCWLYVAFLTGFNLIATENRLPTCSIGSYGHYGSQPDSDRTGFVQLQTAWTTIRGLHMWAPYLGSSLFDYNIILF